MSANIPGSRRGLFHDDGKRGDGAAGGRPGFYLRVLEEGEAGDEIVQVAGPRT
jgi:hypothetical protein